jgi:hypothetical protein
MNQANSESGVIAGSHTERPRHKASRAKIVCRNPLLMCKLRNCVYSATDKFASFSTFRPVRTTSNPSDANRSAVATPMPVRSRCSKMFSYRACRLYRASMGGGTTHPLMNQNPTAWVACNIGPFRYRFTVES